MRFGKTALGLLLAGSLAGCLAGNDQQPPAEQVLRGHVPLGQYSGDVVGVRIVRSGETIATANTDGAGNFNISVPVGRDYAFEVVTKKGAHPLLAGPISGDSPMTFDVCDPGDDFDLGDIDPLDFEEIDGDDVPWTDSEDDCSVPDWLCGDDTNPEDCWEPPLPCEDPDSDPVNCWEPPLPCEAPDADPEFCWYDPPYCNDPEADPATCIPAPPLPCDDPQSSPIDCYEPCVGPDGEPCEPLLPCEDPAANPEDCYFEECLDADGQPIPCWTEPGCEDPSADPATCIPEPPLPCFDPASDPDSCIEDSDPWPCADGGDDEAGCWPEPDICILDGADSPEGFEWCEDIGSAPEYPLPDFGCEGEGDDDATDGPDGDGDWDLPPAP